MVIDICMNVIFYMFSYNVMPDIKMFSSDKERRKFMKRKQFTWFQTFEYTNRHWGVDYVLNFIY